MMGDLWWLGAMLSALGSCCSNFGINTQKLAAMKLAKIRPEDRGPYYKNPTWCLGFGLVILGSLGDFSALGLAAQSIVAPVSAITLVANIFFAHYFLGEHLGRNDVFGSMVILVGCVVAVVFGSRSSGDVTVQDR